MRGRSASWTQSRCSALIKRLFRIPDSRSSDERTIRKWSGNRFMPLTDTTDANFHTSNGKRYAAKVEVLQSMEDHATAQLELLSGPNTNWQPTDFLPDMKAENWREEIAELRAVAASLPDDVL